MDDLERYKQKINHVEDSSLESTRNMLAMMEEVLKQFALKISLDGNNISLDPSDGGGDSAAVRRAGPAAGQGRGPPGHDQRGDEAGGEDPDQDGEVVRPIHLSMEQVVRYFNQGLSINQ